MLHVFPVLPLDRQDQVAALLDSARISDGVAPVSEETHLRLPATASRDWLHLVYVDDGAVVAYAHLDTADPQAPWAELVVAPLSRRRGIGSLLLREMLQRAPATRVWAHGFLPGTATFAVERGLHVVRELWQMARPLADLPPGRQLPAGFAVSTLTPGDERDERDWLAVNAAAFADHPEQGRMTLADLRARQGEPWFDPAGFFLVRDERTADDPATWDGVRGPTPEPGRLAAFHWTKVEHAVGEVYVVGVDPDYQGLGLGAAATWVGLDHLRAENLQTVTLYVDGDNDAAIATYRTLGFERIAVDVQLATRRVPDESAR